MQPPVAASPPPTTTRPTLIALRARREAHQVASKILHRPIDPKSLMCPGCRRDLALAEFDRGNGCVECNCGKRVQLPPHLACYVQPYATIVCRLCGKKLSTRLFKTRDYFCDACGAWTWAPPELWIPNYDPEMEFVLPTFPDERNARSIEARDVIVVTILLAVFALILLLAWILIR